MLPARLQMGSLGPKAVEACGQAGSEAEQIRMRSHSGQPGLLSLSLCHHDAATSLKGHVSDFLEGQCGPN